MVMVDANEGFTTYTQTEKRVCFPPPKREARKWMCVRGGGGDAGGDDLK
jgi:hypothetical protein